MALALLPIEFLAVTRDRDQHAWGLLLHVKTPDGHWHQWAMPLRLFSEAGAELGERCETSARPSRSARERKMRS